MDDLQLTEEEWLGVMHDRSDFGNRYAKVMIKSAVALLISSVLLAALVDGSAAFALAIVLVGVWTSYLLFWSRSNTRALKAQAHQMYIQCQAQHRAALRHID